MAWVVLGDILLVGDSLGEVEPARAGFPDVRANVRFSPGAIAGGVAPRAR